MPDGSEQWGTQRRVHTHPWRWAAVLGGSVAVWATVLRFGVFHRSMADSLSEGTMMGAIWFIATAVLGWLRRRGERRER